jgi:hypothetical protein
MLQQQNNALSVYNTTPHKIGEDIQLPVCAAAVVSSRVPFYESRADPFESAPHKNQ